MKHAALLLLSLTASTASAEVTVVATVPDLAAIAREVVGDRGKVVALSLDSQDPHWVDARPSLALELSKADLLIAIGLEMEMGWLPNLQVGSRNAKIQVGASGYLDSSTLVSKLEVPNHKIDRSMGDVHSGGNPHFLYDPRRVVVVARGIGERLAAIDPEGAAIYRQNAARLGADLEKRTAEWKLRLASLAGTKAVGYHRSLAYLAEWVGLEVVDHIEPKPGIAPNPGHIAQLIKRMRADGVRLVLQESFHARTTAELVAAKSGAKVAVFDGGARFDKGQTIADRFERLVAALEAAR